jgi:hypothetical protein
MYFFCRYFRVHQNCGRTSIPTWVMVTVTIITQHCIMLPNMAWSICWGNQPTAVVTGERVQKGSQGLIIRWSTEVDRLEYGNRVASSTCCTVIKAVCVQQIWPYDIWHSQCREYSEFGLPSCYFMHSGRYLPPSWRTYCHYLQVKRRVYSMRREAPDSSSMLACDVTFCNTIIQISGIFFHQPLKHEFFSCLPSAQHGRTT